MTGASEVVVRAVDDVDVDEIVGLAARSLGWAADERDRAFFRWKHFENPLGRSPAWAAFEGDRMVAFRTLLRCELLVDDTRLGVVRAVDTATDPDFQGQGLFRRLTTHAVHELTAAGVAAVYNTPNDQSRPGYLRMGWSQLGRPTLWVQPSGPVTLTRLVRAQVAAEKWSEPVTVGVPAIDVVGDVARADVLRWRYGFEPLHYRAIEVSGGHAIFRVRRRGPLREVAICEWRSPRADPGAIRRLVRECGDYAVAVGLSFGHGLAPLPSKGPVVTWRPLARSAVPGLADIALSLGDLELL